MSRRWLIGCWSLLLASASGSTPGAACGWYGCDGYGYYGRGLGAPVAAAAYGFYATPAYYVPAPVVVYLPPPVTYAPLPVYQYGPPTTSVYYGAPAAGPYYGYGDFGVRRTVRYYGPRRAVVSARYYGPRRAYVRPVVYAGPARRAVRR